MLAAVQFNDQFLPRGAEIGDVSVNGMLTAKVNATFLPHQAEPLPQQLFGRCGLMTQFHCAVEKSRRGSPGRHGLIILHPFALPNTALDDTV